MTSYVVVTVVSQYSMGMLTLLCKWPAKSMEQCRFGVSEPPNPWTDWHKIWHGWLYQWYYPCAKIQKKLPSGGIPAYRSSITLVRFVHCG